MLGWTPAGRVVQIRCWWQHALMLIAQQPSPNCLALLLAMTLH